jgi:hypothetical protein
MRQRSKRRPTTSPGAAHTARRILKASWPAAREITITARYSPHVAPATPTSALPRQAVALPDCVRIPLRYRRMCLAQVSCHFAVGPGEPARTCPGASFRNRPSPEGGGANFGDKGGRGGFFSVLRQKWLLASETAVGQVVRRDIRGWEFWRRFCQRLATVSE